MLTFAQAVMRKDVRLILASGGTIWQPILLGVLIIFLFSLAIAPGEATTPRMAAAIFWLSSVFCQTLVFGQLYALEEVNLARHTLLLARAPIQGVWLGKAMAGLVFLLIAQLVFVPAIIVFFNQRISGPFLPGFMGIIAVNIGIATLGSMLGALEHGHSSRNALLSILIFPLLVPLLMAGMSLCAQTLGELPPGDFYAWIGLAWAFDAVFVAAALLMFGFLYDGED